MALFFLIWAVGTVPAGIIPQVAEHGGLGPASGVGSFVTFLVFWGVCAILARRRCADNYLALRRTLIEAGLDHPSTLDTAKADCLRWTEAIDTRRRSDMNRASQKFAATMGDILRRKELDVAEIETKYPPRLAAIAAARERCWTRPTPSTLPCSASLKSNSRPSPMRCARNTRAMQESLARYDANGPKWPAAGAAGWSGSAPRLEEIADDCQRLFPDWHTEELNLARKPAAETPVAVRFGQAEIKLAKPRGGVPKDERLRPAQADFALPLLLPLPLHSTFLFKRPTTAGAGRRIHPGHHAASLDALPPGKVRFTILDPGRPGRQFLRLHAPGRLRRTADRQPHLDRTGAHRATPGRPDATTWRTSSSCICRNQFKHHRGIQRLGGRNGRTVPRAGRGQLPRQFLPKLRRNGSRASWQSGPRAACSIMLSIDTRCRRRTASTWPTWKQAPPRCNEEDGQLHLARSRFPNVPR